MVVGIGLRAVINRWGFLFLCLLLFYSASDPDGTTEHDHNQHAFYRESDTATDRDL